MKLSKCDNGHFYDADKYPACPYCNTDLQADPDIVRGGTAAIGQAASPEGAVAGWLVVLDGTERGRDLRLGIGRSFLGMDTSGTPVTLSPNAPLGARLATIAYDAEKNAFTLLPGSSQELCYLNDAAVLEPVPLKGGETLRLGKVSLRFVAFCGKTFRWTEEARDGK